MSYIPVTNVTRSRIELVHISIFDVSSRLAESSQVQLDENIRDTGAVATFAHDPAPPRLALTLRCTRRRNGLSGSGKEIC